MTDPDTAALDPIFWLHHSNIDRLWEVWRQSAGHANPSVGAWLDRSFRLRDAGGAAVRMKARDVLDTVVQLDYTYDTVPAVAAAAGEGPAVAPRSRPVMVGRNQGPVSVGRAGATTRVALGPVPEHAAAAADGPRVFLNLADIEGERNPGFVFGVYVNLPENPSPADLAQHLAGVVSFFGIEQGASGPAAAAGRESHAMRYSFDVTDLVARLRSSGRWDDGELRVALIPVEDGTEDEPAGASAGPNVRVGTVSFYAG
jgi:tyrosinase